MGDIDYGERVELDPNIEHPTSNIQLDNRPGMLARVADALAAAKINIEYCYSAPREGTRPTAPRPRTRRRVC